PGLVQALANDPTALEDVPPDEVAFVYHIEASATPLTPAEFVAAQQQQAARLRAAILADPTAAEPLKVLAADQAGWTDLYFTALQQAGLLRAQDQPPEVHQNPDIASLMSTLAAGILAGPAGNQIITDGNLVNFFAQVHKWYGDDPTATAEPPGQLPGSFVD